MVILNVFELFIYNEIYLIRNKGIHPGMRSLISMFGAKSLSIVDQCNDGDYVSYF